MSTLQIPRRIPANKLSYDNSVPCTGYAGATKDELALGFRESLTNELDFLGLTNEFSETLIRQCDGLIRHFLVETWRSWASLKTEEFAEVVMANMKHDTKDIISFVEESIPYLRISEDSDFMCNYVYQASRPDKTSGCDGNNVCINCPRYIARQFYLCPVDMVEEEVIASHWFRIEFKPYRYLWKATLLLYQFVMKFYNEEFEEGAYNTLLMLPSAIGKLYEMTNPVGSLLDTLCDDKIQQLERQPEEHSDAEWEFFERIWDEVYSDITSTRLPYVNTWRRALRRLDAQRQFNESDYFLSQKSSSYRIVGLQTQKRNGKRMYKRKQCSYFISMAENDPIKDDPVVQAFDAEIGYQSHYNSQINPRLKGDWSHYTYVLNKGKRKLRGIRLECNAVQDRCQYLENIEKEWQDFIAYNARKNQPIGYALGINATRVWNEYKCGLRTDTEHWPSLYNTDFSDATDTVSQHVLYRYNLTFYGKIKADFWQYICSKDFNFKLAGTQDSKVCYPHVGNPQGCKKSFTDFNGLHLYLMAMVFKILAHLKEENPELFRFSIDYERTPIELAASVLGDDNGFWSIKADPEVDERVFEFFDPSMGHSGAMYQVYCWLCKMCNWYINPDKAQITTPNSSIAIWEFAKVTVVNGKTQTSPPFRMVGYMASRKVSHPIVKPLSFALWRMKTKHEYADLFMKTVLQRYSDSEEMYSYLYKLVFGGFIKSLQEYFEPDLVSEQDRALIYLSLIRAELRVGLISQILSESECDIENSYELSNLLWNNFDEKLYNQIEDKEHKFNILLDRHLVLVDLARTIEGLSSVDDKLLETFCAVTAIRNGYSDKLDKVLDTILQAQETIQFMEHGLMNVDNLINIMNGIDDSDLSDLQRFTSDLITRGTDKRPSVESAIGIEAWNEYILLLEQLAPFDGADTSIEAHPDS